jgi:hypothetical protein
MAHTVFKSTDASAPVLTGQVGTLVALLDACLVSGYGATASLGWAKAFTGTNKAVYRSPDGTRFYLRVQDDGPGARVGGQARAVAYESMTDVDTGVDPYPTVAQRSDGLLWDKSATADATARAWSLVGDGKRFALLVQGAGSPSYLDRWDCWFFGDILSYKAGDAYHSMIVGHTGTEGSAQVQSVGTILTSGAASTVLGHYLCRRNDSITKSVPVGVVGDYAAASHTSCGASSSYPIPYPDPVSGKLLIAPLRVVHAGTTEYVVRGLVPGIHDVLHNNPLADQDTFTLGGEAFTLYKTYLGVFAFKTSAWE